MRRVFIIGYCLCIYALAFGTAGANSHDVRLSFLATKVTDGDSIRSGKFRLRLYGIDAPETRQQCHDKANQPYQCGVMATQYLANLAMKDRPLDCVLKDIDRYRRLVVQCRSDGLDIAAQMVRAGWAVAYRRYASDYIDDEARAKAEDKGMWQGDFISPETWRRQQK